MAVVWRGQRSRVRLRCPDPLPSALWYTKNRREKEEKKKNRKKGEGRRRKKKKREVPFDKTATISLGVR